MAEMGLEPIPPLRGRDFKSRASAIPPLGLSYTHYNRIARAPRPRQPKRKQGQPIGTLSLSFRPLVRTDRQLRQVAHLLAALQYVLPPIQSCVEGRFRVSFAASLSFLFTPPVVHFAPSALPPMMDYEVQHSARRCSTTGREFAPGETYYSVLVAEGAELKRYDYAADAWQGPPEEAIGWWKSQVPDRTAGKKHWAPNDVMLDFWDKLADQPDKQDMRYVLTLLLVRRRVFRLEEEKSDERGRAVAGGVLSPPRSHVSSARRRAGADADRSDSGGVGGAAAIDGK